jgi:hypothetical protein
METLNHVTSVLAEIQTRNVTNTSKKKYCLSQILCNYISGTQHYKVEWMITIFDISKFFKAAMLIVLMTNYKEGQGYNGIMFITLMSIPEWVMDRETYVIC